MTIEIKRNAEETIIEIAGRLDATMENSVEIPFKSWK